jgi:ADP-ribose pyrophosphatase YjhB (NUDIX family)
VKTCDNASVGVLIARDGRYLMFDRNTFPAGTAPCAGHVFDEHASYQDAARAEVAEELGLSVESLVRLPAGGWRANRCRRQPGPRGMGHEWQVFGAVVSGEMHPSQRETRNARWLTPAEIQRLADRTALYAWGGLTDQAFTASPGLEPVWAGFLADLALIRLSRADLALIARVAETGTNTPAA